jgi:hypothetical protein
MPDLTYRCVSYPAFEPDHEWLRKILLFVDEIYRIMPGHEASSDSDRLKQLIEATCGAIRVCEPAPYIEITDAAAKNFGTALDQPRFLEIARSKTLTFVLKEGTKEVLDWEFLHVEKIGSHVRTELKKRNMLRPSLGEEHWEIVPRGVGSLVVGMLADRVAERNGLDAITDQPLAFALNGLNQCCAEDSARIEGVIASSVASVHVPKSISLLSTKEYVELRKAHEQVRAEFARMVRELKQTQRISAKLEPNVFKERINGIVGHVEIEMQRFRTSKEASKFNDWVPFSIASLAPLAAGLAFGPIPGVATGVFSFCVNAIGKLTKKSETFRYPKVMQALCAADDAGRDAAIRSMGII